jgi:hypothetical protein
MHLATAFDYTVTHIFNHTRKFVGTNMRMRIGQYRRTSAMLAQEIEHTLDITAFLAAGI